MANEPNGDIQLVGRLGGGHLGISEDLLKLARSWVITSRYSPKVPYTVDDLALRTAFQAGQKDIVEKLQRLYNKQ